MRLNSSKQAQAPQDRRPWTQTQTQTVFLDPFFLFLFFNNVMNGGSDGAWTDFKEFPQSDVVQSVGAVEDDTLLRHGFGQVLGRLRLPRPGRTFWCSTQMKLESSKQGAVRGGVDAVVMATMNNL